jgi:lysozyme family protein
MRQWKFAYQDIDELEQLRPRYQDIGHPKSTEDLGLRHDVAVQTLEQKPMPYLYVPKLDEVVFGNNHSDIMRKLMGPPYNMDQKEAFQTLYGNWSGRFDFNNDVISVQMLTQPDENVEVPPGLIERLKQEFRQHKDADFLPVVPYGKSGQPIVRNDKLHFYAKGKWRTKYASTEDNEEMDSAQTESETFVIHDVDRYCSDDYAINVALQETKSRYSIGLYVTNWKVGVSGYQEYWHFDKDERTDAYKTYETVIDKISSLVEEIEWNEVPMSLVKPMIRNALDSVDLDHKERSGVAYYNIYRTDVPKAADWRATLYGPRYPAMHVDTMDRTFNVVETESARIEKEDVGRNQVWKYRRAQNSLDKKKHAEYHVLSKSGWTRIDGSHGGQRMLKKSSVLDQLRKNWKATVPLMTFLSWYVAHGGTPEQLAQEVEQGKTVPQIVQQIEPEPTPQPEVFTEQTRDPFEDVLSFTLELEGANDPETKGYSDHPDDPGGETFKGVTRDTYEDYLKQQGISTENVDMRAIPDDHIKDIYRKNYWEATGADQLPPIVGQQVFDFAVNSGPSRAVKYLQRIVGSKPDGIFGPKTLAATQEFIQAHGETSLALEYLNRRAAFVRNFVKKHPKFPGLLTRIEKMRSLIPMEYEPKGMQMRSKEPPPSLPPFESMQSKLFTGGRWSHEYT